MIAPPEFVGITFRIMRQPLLPHGPLPLRILLLRPGLPVGKAERAHGPGDQHRQPAWQRGGMDAHHRRDGDRSVRRVHALGQRAQQQMPAHAVRYDHAWPCPLCPPIGDESSKVRNP